MAFYRGTRYDDDFAGTSGNDTFSFASVHLGPGDRVQGGAGIDNVQLGQVGPGPAWQLDAADLDAFDSIETYTLSFGIGRFTLSDALVGRAEGRRVSIVVGVGVNPVTLTDASALTGDHRIAFFGYAPNHHVLGGAGNDTFQFIYGLSTATVIDGGAGTDTLILADVAQTAASLTGIASIEELHLSGTSTGVTLDDAFLARNGVDGRLVVNAVAADSTIDASAVTNVQHALDLSIYTGAVNATGGAGADIFRHVYGFGGIATIAGGEGNAQDQLVLKAASDYGAGFFDTITGIERVVLGTGGSSLVVTDALVASAWDDRLVVVGSAGDDVVDARGVAAGRRVEMVAGTGDDVLRGGAADTSFHFDVTALTATDVVEGGIGRDRLVLNGSGTVVLGANVSGVETVVLNGNQVALSVDAAFAARTPAGWRSAASRATTRSTCRRRSAPASPSMWTPPAARTCCAAAAGRTCSASPTPN